MQQTKVGTHNDLYPHLVDLQAGPDHDSPAVRGGGGPHSVPHT